MRKKVIVAVVTVTALAVAAQLTYAQRGEGGRGEGSGGRGGVRFDPAQMQERMLQYQKEALKASDEEWKVLEPLVKKVFEARMATRQRGFGGRRGMGDRDSGGEREPRPGTRFGESQASPEADALQKVLEDPNASADDIQAKLAALRKAREEARKKLEKAQEELRQVLTTRQEAQLVLMGTLD